MKHLQHEPFNYVIDLDNQTGSDQELTIRIFLAPIQDESGRKFTLREQRVLMMEMDKFTQKGPFILL